MKSLSIKIVAIAVATLAACGDGNNTNHETPVSQDTATAAPADNTAVGEPEDAPMDSAAMTKAWEAYMTPGEMQKWMSSTDGKWDAEFTFWMSPGAPPQGGSSAKMENKTVMGGRYQVSDYKGTMMGMDFEGHGIMAYDNGLKKFINTWIDNTGTGLMYMEGTMDEAKKTITLTGDAVDPVTGKKSPMRQVLTIVDDKHQTLEMYNSKNGQEYKSMEIRLVKK